MLGLDLYKLKCGDTIYDTRRKREGCVCGYTRSGNYSILLVHWDGNKDPSRINIMDVLQKNGGTHPYTLVRKVLD